jgi:hypothetical protein
MCLDEVRDRHGVDERAVAAGKNDVRHGVCKSRRICNDASESADAAHSTRAGTRHLPPHLLAPVVIYACVCVIPNEGKWRVKGLISCRGNRALEEPEPGNGLGGNLSAYLPEDVRTPHLAWYVFLVWRIQKKCSRVDALNVKKFTRIIFEALKERPDKKRCGTRDTRERFIDVL